MSGKTKWIVRLKSGRFFHGIDKGSKKFPATGIHFNDWLRNAELLNRKKDGLEVTRNYKLDADVLKVRVTIDPLLGEKYELIDG